MDLPEQLAGAPKRPHPGSWGQFLVSEVAGKPVKARITEVEAYKGSDDPASHAYRGRTRRNGSMFERPGTLYVYRSYGIHWCANVAAGPEGVGWGILFRGGEIVDGLGVARSRRGRERDLANGPGKLTQALGLDHSHDGTFLFDGSSPIRLEPGPTAGPGDGDTAGRHKPGDRSPMAIRGGVSGDRWRAVPGSSPTYSRPADELRHARLPAPPRRSGRPGRGPDPQAGAGAPAPGQARFGPPPPRR